MMALAGATGWSEDFCKWMPLSRALVYIHAHNVGEGADTRWVFVDEVGAERTRAYLREIIG